MEHFYVENNEAQLYSVYYEPKKSRNNSKGVILCYPVGQEYIRCHRMYSSIAKKLSQEGVHVVKFDYYGTGDSYGDFTSCNMSQWVSDVKEVTNQLKEAADIETVILVGVRLGATISLQFAKEEKVDGLVLLSPVFDGEKYINEIKKDYGTWLSGSFAKQGKLNDGEVESYGFLYSKELTLEINNLNNSNLDLLEQIPTFYVDEYPLFQSPNVNFKQIETNNLWKKNKRENDTEVLPIAEINAIVSWVLNF